MGKRRVVDPGRVSVWDLASELGDIVTVQVMADQIQAIDGTTGDLTEVQADFLRSAYALAETFSVADLSTGRDPVRVRALVAAIQEVDGTSGDLDRDQAEKASTGYRRPSSYQCAKLKATRTKSYFR